MQNVQKGKKYPACWLTGGLHDPRVAYWEPAKVSDWQLLLQVTEEDGNQFICVRDMTELYQCDVHYYFTNKHFLSSISGIPSLLLHCDMPILTMNTLYA